MNSPIVAHIKQNKLSCSYWLYITKTNPLWCQLNRDLIQYIYWMIFERHPAQIWHDRVFDEIAAPPTVVRNYWNIIIPPEYGKTYMAKRLVAYYQRYRHDALTVEINDDEEGESYYLGNPNVFYADITVYLTSTKAVYVPTLPNVKMKYRELKL